MPEKDIRLRIFVDDKNLAALGRMTKMLEQAAAAEAKLRTRSMAKTKELKKQADAVKQDGREIDKTTQSTRTWTQQIIRNIGKVLEWAVATGAVYGALQAVRTAMDDLISVEFAMAGLTKVMREGERRAASLRPTLLKLGQAYGELGTAVIDASTEWARLQLSTIEIAENARAALLAQAVAEMEVVDATRYLIASMKQFDQSALANLRTLDQWNELSNRMAVRAVDMATATARAGSVMNNAGVEIQRLNAYTAALVQATGRSGQEIGTAVRTMGTYIYRVQTVNALQQKANILVQNSAGQHKRFSTIVSELAANWAFYTDAVRRQTAQSVAGARRANEFLVLMSQYPEVLNALVIAWESLGSAEEEATIYLDTARKKLDQFRAGMQRLATEYGDALLPGAKGFLDVINWTIDALIKAKEVIIAAAAVFGIMAARAILATSAMIRLSTAITTFISLNPALVAFVAGIGAATIALKVLARQTEQTLTAQQEVIQAAVADAKATEARVERLGWLIRVYERLRAAQSEALRTGAEDAERYDQYIEDIGRRLEIITRAQAGAFSAGSDKWVESLRRARDMLADLRGEHGKLHKDALNQVQAQLSALAQMQKFTERYIDLLGRGMDSSEAWHQVSEEMGRTGEEMFQVMLDSGLATEKRIYGIVAAIQKLVGAEELTPIHIMRYIAELDNAKEVKSTLLSLTKDLENALDALGLPKEFIDALMDATLTAEQLRDILYALRLQMRQTTEEYRHRAAMAEIAGATEVEQLEMARKAILQNIAAVDQKKEAYKDDEKATAAFGKELDNLNLALTNINNRIKEAVPITAMERINAVMTTGRAAYRELYATAIQLARARDENIKAAELHIEQLQQERDEVQQAIDDAEKLGVDLEDLLDIRMDLNGQIREEIKLLNQIVIPMEVMRRERERQREAEEAFRKELELTEGAHSRRLGLMRAAGMSAVEVARAELRQADQAYMLSTRRNQNMEVMLELYDNWQDALSNVKAAEIAAARSIAEAWISEYERRERAWEKMFVRMAGDLGAGRRTLMDALDRLRGQMIGRWAREAFGGLIKNLTEWELRIEGLSPERMRAEAENRRMLVMALMQGGSDIQGKMLSAGQQVAGMIASAISTGTVPALRPFPGGGMPAARPLPDSALPYELRGGGGGGVPGWQTAGMWGLMVGLPAARNARRWFEERGGGVQMAGFGAGAVIGGALGGPYGAAFGASIGQELVAGIQDIFGRGEYRGKQERGTSPQAETLREQLGAGIAQGQFREAANITYNIENNYNMGFLIPDREQIRRVKVILDKENADHARNVNVS
jgi:TP901 family phage tail tape measure protein